MGSRISPRLVVAVCTTPRRPRSAGAWCQCQHPRSEQGPSDERALGVTQEEPGLLHDYVRERPEGFRSGRALRIPRRWHCGGVSGQQRVLDAGTETERSVAAHWIR